MVKRNIQNFSSIFHFSRTVFQDCFGIKSFPGLVATLFVPRINDFFFSKISPISHTCFTYVKHKQYWIVKLCIFVCEAKMYFWSFLKLNLHLKIFFVVHVSNCCSASLPLVYIFKSGLTVCLLTPVCAVCLCLWVWYTKSEYSQETTCQTSVISSLPTCVDP